MTFFSFPIYFRKLLLLWQEKSSQNSTKNIFIKLKFYSSLKAVDYILRATF